MTKYAKTADFYRLTADGDVSDKEAYGGSANVSGVEIEIIPASTEYQALAGISGEVYIASIDDYHDVKEKDKCVIGSASYIVNKITTVDFSNRSFKKLELIKNA